MQSLPGRPRVAVFRLLGAPFLLGVVIGVLLDRDDPNGSPAIRQCLGQAERGVRERARFLTRITAQLRRDLRRAERARRPAKAAGDGNRSR